jgi:spoIIIJ-associated protein
MRFTEVEGKNKQDAIEKAARELNVPVAEIGIEILSDSSRGFFSLIGGRKVKIRAWSKRESREELLEEVEKIKDAVLPLTEPDGNGRTGNAARSQDARKPRNGAKARDTAKGRDTVKPKELPKPRDAVKPKEPPKSPNAVKAREPQKLRDEARTPKAQEAKKILEDILAWLSEQATVKVREETQERIRLEIHGDKTGLLIGKRGQTLDALQFLVNKMVNRSADNSIRIEVDMEQYRKRREQSLRNMATRLGEKVKKKKKPITIEAMNAHDRRIIHLTLKNDQSLETKSVGKGEMRKLVIHPANNGRSKGHEGSGVSS